MGSAYQGSSQTETSACHVEGRIHVFRKKRNDPRQLVIVLEKFQGVQTE